MNFKLRVHKNPPSSIFFWSLLKIKVRFLPKKISCCTDFKFVVTNPHISKNVMKF